MNVRVPDIRLRAEDNLLLASGYGPRSQFSEELTPIFLD